MSKSSLSPRGPPAAKGARSSSRSPTSCACGAVAYSRSLGLGRGPRSPTGRRRVAAPRCERLRAGFDTRERGLTVMQWGSSGCHGGASPPSPPGRGTDPSTCCSTSCSRGLPLGRVPSLVRRSGCRTSWRSPGWCERRPGRARWLRRQLDVMCANYTTVVLGDLVRTGTLWPGGRRPPPPGVRPPAQAPRPWCAVVGRAADLVVFDPVASGPTGRAHDLPGRSARLYAEAVGISRWSSVADHRRRGVSPGSLPGTLLRSVSTRTRRF